MADAECDDYDGWMRRATAAGADREPLIRFATWYPAVLQRWLDAATAAGVWAGGRDPGRSGRDYCRQASDSLGHAERSDGVVVHFIVEAAGRPYAFRARWCREQPPIRLAQRWTDDQRLTWQEFTSGEPCRGCGRGFVGGRERKPILQRTPDEAAAAALEEADFRARHPDCATMTWAYGATGVTHCSECCPPPPLSRHQVEVIARIAVDVARRQHQEALEFERRWRAAADAPVP
jgi:hypothetical protein